MPNLVHVKRDYSKIFEKYIALGPNIENKMGAHGMVGMYLMNIKHCTQKWYYR